MRKPALILAAMALPRDQLLRLAELDQDPATVALGTAGKRDKVTDELDLVRMKLASVMGYVAAEKSAGHADAEEKLLVRALSLAAETPEVSDDLQVFQAIALLSNRHRLGPETIAACVEAIGSVFEKGDRSVLLALATALVLTLVQGNGLLDPPPTRPSPSPHPTPLRTRSTERRAAPAGTIADVTPLAGLPARGVRSRPKMGPPSGGRPRGVRTSCEGEDSNLHGSYPASTSS